jgi:hypothetical protein
MIRISFSEFPLEVNRSSVSINNRNSCQLLEGNNASLTIFQQFKIILSSCFVKSGFLPYPKDSRCLLS